mmetsp:Transcript_46216/g.91101  ORF Transcript_46216/g.91101 Transcript_46216/m.91101 type:complete len:339 (+) Transcript_46216:176-1192(+)
MRFLGILAFALFCLSEPSDAFNCRNSDRRQDRLSWRRQIRRGDGLLTRAAVSVSESQLLDEIIDTAEQAARRAGVLILEKSGAPVLDTKLNAKDLVTLVDKQCEDVIRETVSSRFPDHEFLGEEDTPPGRDASVKALQEKLQACEERNKFLWVCDPIDGTINFVHGQLLSGVSLAVVKGGEVVAGVLYDPYHDELYHAKKGGGAFCNGKKIKVGAQQKAADAVIAAGSPPDPANLDPMMRGCAAVAPHIRTLRLLGSAAIMFAWVACGRLTGYFEIDLHPWDHAAGVLIVEEAGGKVTDMEGKPYTISKRGIVASNASTDVHETMLRELKAADAIRAG